MTTRTPAFSGYASCDCTHVGLNDPAAERAGYILHREQLRGVHFSARFATLEEAQAFAAQFPKSLNLKAGSLSGDPAHKAIVSFQAYFKADGVQGKANETGAKRVKRLLELASVEVTPEKIANGLTRAEMEAALQRHLA